MTCALLRMWIYPRLGIVLLPYIEHLIVVEVTRGTMGCSGSKSQPPPQARTSKSAKTESKPNSVKDKGPKPTGKTTENVVETKETTDSLYDKGIVVIVVVAVESRLLICARA